MQYILDSSEEITLTHDQKLALFKHSELHVEFKEISEATVAYLLFLRRHGIVKSAEDLIN